MFDVKHTQSRQHGNNFVSFFERVVEKIKRDYCNVVSGKVSVIDRLRENER